MSLFQKQMPKKKKYFYKAVIIALFIDTTKNRYNLFRY